MFYYFMFSVNFKKNEKVYNSAQSEVFKMLQEQGQEPETGNVVVNDELLSHYYTLACMLKVLNGDGNIFAQDQIID